MLSDIPFFPLLTSAAKDLFAYDFFRFSWFYSLYFSHPITLSTATLQNVTQWEYAN